MKWVTRFQSWLLSTRLKAHKESRLFGLDAVQGHSTLRDEPSGSDSKRSRLNKKSRFQNWMLGAISYRGTEQGVQIVRRVSTTDKNRAPAPEALAAQRAPLAGRLMRSGSGGYTIVEVMVFLMISAVIFFGAATVFQGQQGRSQFQQGMRDIASKIQRDVDGVGTSLVPGGDQYTCSVSAQTGRAQLSTGSSGVGTSQACIFLGRAIQVVPGQSRVFIYSVLGNHYTSDNEPVTSLSSALPEPAIAPGADLTDEYDAAWGKVLSSKVTYISGTDANSDLVGFYASLRDGYQNSSAAGGQSITAKGYNFTSTSLDSARSSLVKSCLEERNADGVNCASTSLISKWTVCFASTGSNQTALLSVSSTPSGVVMGTDFTDCS